MLASRWHRCIGLRAAYHGGIGVVRSSSSRATSSTTTVPVIISPRPGGGGVEAVGGDVLDTLRARVPGTARRRNPHLENRLYYSSSSSSSSSPSASSSSSLSLSSSSSFARSEYVHPLSQIVLERLQSSHADWVSRVGLDTGLKLNGDGTFVLRFPPPPAGGGVAMEDAAAAVAADDVVDGSVVGDPASSGGDDAGGGSIW